MGLLRPAGWARRWVVALSRDQPVCARVMAGRGGARKSRVDRAAARGGRARAQIITAVVQQLGVVYCLLARAIPPRRLASVPEGLGQKPKGRERRG
jgi:hypothetical protein